MMVEFTGISRVLTGQTEYPLNISASAQISDVLQAISKQYPILIGDVIEKDGKTLVPTNLFSINGKKIVNEEQLDYQPEDGDRLILLSLLAGG